MCGIYLVGNQKGTTTPYKVRVQSTTTHERRTDYLCKEFVEDRTVPIYMQGSTTLTRTTVNNMATYPRALVENLDMLQLAT